MRTASASLSLLLFAGGTVALPAAPLFEDQSTLDIELAGPVGTLIGTRHQGEEMQFTLRVDGVEHDVGVRTRGRSRLRTCSFPPLRLNFRSHEMTGTVFEGQDKLKLVTECRQSRTASFDVLEEYAAYRIFNLVTDASYRVRPVRLYLSDADGKLKKAHSEMNSFLVESRAELSARLGAARVSLPGISTDWLESRQAALVYVFQYVIGNTDWSLVNAYGTDSCCHNMTLLGERPDILLVPYDFDLAGLVDARYARPDASLGIASVTTRVYRGFCLPRQELESALAGFRDRESDIVGVIASLPGADEKDRAVTLRYLEKFFDKARDTERMLTLFDKRCLN